jgi:hypothetical protein
LLAQQKRRQTRNCQTFVFGFALVCEQEIIVAESEINFMTPQAMEDMHLAEESKAASLLHLSACSIHPIHILMY